MPEVFVGLGSNLGDPVESLGTAVHRLGEVIDVSAVSSLYRTEPIGVRDQPFFLNAALKGTTSLPPAEVLERFLAVERSLGRERTVPMGPRTIDLDLLLYGDETLDADGLTVPHPRMHVRRFVLEPLAEVGPDVIHPVLGRTIAQILKDLPSADLVERVEVQGWPPAGRE